MYRGSLEPGTRQHLDLCTGQQLDLGIIGQQPDLGRGQQVDLCEGQQRNLGMGWVDELTGGRAQRQMGGLVGGGRQADGQMSHSYYIHPANIAARGPHGVPCGLINEFRMLDRFVPGSCGSCVRENPDLDWQASASNLQRHLSEQAGN